MDVETLALAGFVIMLVCAFVALLAGMSRHPNNWR